MPEKRRIQEPPIRIKTASRATAERIASATGLNYIQVIEQAVEAAGQHFDHHGGRLLLPLRFTETFSVKTIGPLILHESPAAPKPSHAADSGRTSKSVRIRAVQA